MSERGINDAMLEVLLETGNLKRMGGEYLFIFKHFPDRHDNLVCAAAVEEDYLVIKTVMVGWSLREQT